MNKNTDIKTSKLLLHKQEISRADLDTASGGRFFGSGFGGKHHGAGFFKKLSKVSGAFSNAVSISTAVSGVLSAGKGNGNSEGNSEGAQ